MDDHQAAVIRTARRVRQARLAHDEHVTAVLNALRAGHRPTDVADWSAFTAAYVRKLARDAGIPPARPGRKKA